MQRDGVLRRASIDHSYVQELVATGHITEAEARTHPRRNIVTRALGIEPQVRVDTWTLRLVQGDRYVLCSDGLVDEVIDDEIQDVLNRIDDPQEAAEELVALANVHGGRDNITVVVVDVLAGAEPSDRRVPPRPTATPGPTRRPTTPTTTTAAPKRWPPRSGGAGRRASSPTRPPRRRRRWCVTPARAHRRRRNGAG